MIKNALYYKHSYLKEFETVVKDCFIQNEKIKVVLEDTAFYPEGGGQNADLGQIDGVKVLFVEEKDNTIYHIVEKELEVGKKVKAVIDFDNRFANMQKHTGEHIVSGIICKKFNANNVGFHMGDDYVTLDFDVSISKEELRDIEKEANMAIYKNIDIIEKIYTPEEAKKIVYRSKRELNEDIRIIEIPGYDICACCGVHVAKTGEIGIIKLLKVQKYKAGCRIFMLAGLDAVNDYTDKFNQIDNISTLLSLKLNEVYDGVEKLLRENEVLQKEKNMMKKSMYEQEIRNLANNKNIILKKENIDMNDMKNICNMLEEKVEDIYGVLSNERFIIMSKKTDLREILDKLKKSGKANGGGSSNMIQGVAKCQDILHGLQDGIKQQTKWKKEQLSNMVDFM